MTGYHQFCGLAVAMDAIGDRWNLLIVRELLISRRRFSELRSALPGVASNLLTARLRALEEAGLVARVQRPARKAVEYSLTPTGEGLRESVYALIRWGAQFMDAAPDSEDTVREEWIQLAAQALLDPSVVGTISMEVTGEGQVALTVEPLRTGVPARIEGTPSAVLGVVAGVLPAARAIALGVRVDDGDGLLESAVPRHRLGTRLACGSQLLLLR